MEQETFLCGYCRCLDDARTVLVITEAGRLLEVDCSFESCPHAPGCTIGQKIKELLAC